MRKPTSCVDPITPENDFRRRPEAFDIEHCTDPLPANQTFANAGSDLSQRVSPWRALFLKDRRISTGAEDYKRLQLDIRFRC